MLGSPSWAPQTATRWQILTSTTAQCVFGQNLVIKLIRFGDLDSVRLAGLAEKYWTKFEWLKVVG